MHPALGSGPGLRLGHAGIHGGTVASEATAGHLLTAPPGPMQSWGMAHTALLTDGPLAGDRIPVELTDRSLPPQFLVVPVPSLDEAREETSWRDMKYARLQLFRTRSDPMAPWEYYLWE